MNTVSSRGDAVKVLFSICVAVFLSLSAFAWRLSLPALPASSWADTEIETNVVFDAGSSADNMLRLSIELNATVSNSVEVVFGIDSDNDGKLGIAEGEFAIGWDSGEWFLRDRRVNDIRRVGASAGRQRLDWTLYLHQDRSIRGLESNVFAPTFLPTYFNAAWNMVRVVVSGTDAANENVGGGVSPQGYFIEFK